MSVVSTSKQQRPRKKRNLTVKAQMTRAVRAMQKASLRDKVEVMIKAGLITRQEAEAALKPVEASK